MSCNDGKTDGEARKSNRKCFFHKNVFDVNQKHFQLFQGKLFLRHNMNLVLM